MESVILSVTTLGSRDGRAAGAARAVVNYLDGRAVAPGGRRPGELADVPRPEGDGLVGYYADSVEGPGHWLGRGFAGVAPEGVVDPEQLYRVLLGQDPVTGDQLMGAQGSAVRAERERHQGRGHSSTPGDDAELLSVPRAAELLGVSRQYLARLAREGELARARRAEQEAAGKEQTPFADNYIEAVRSVKRGHHWQVSRREVERFAASRVAPTAVVGYDLTFSCPKSVSVLWATAKPTEQAEILESVAAAVGAGVAYLEDHAAYVQGSPHPAKGLVGASFLHATSRALEPQLHHHVVVANMTERADGKFSLSTAARCSATP